MAEAVYLQDAVARYLARREKTTSHGTFVNDRSLVLRFKGFIGGNPRMRSITSDQVFDFFYSGTELALNEGLAETTFNVARGRLGHFMRFCERRGWTAGTMMDEVITKTVPEQNQRRFTATELWALCNAPVHPQEKILVALACNTALRITDIRSLRMCTVDGHGDLDPATPTVDLAGGWLHVRISKSHKQDDLPIELELDAAIREWLTHYSEHLGRPLEPGMFLVPAKENIPWGTGPDDTRDTFRYKPLNRISRPEDQYLRAVQAAGLPFTKGNGWHTLRRSFARIFYEEMKRRGHPDPIRPVQATLHHDKPEMTYHYIGVQVDRQDRNEVLRGQMFLSRLAADATNVTQLRAVEQ